MSLGKPDLSFAPQMLMFAAVVEANNFTGAATVLGISKSQLSKQISQLEEGIGVRLLHRHARGVTPTEAGLLFHERCIELRGLVAQAEDAVRESQSSLAGSVRLSAPLSFGQRFLRRPLVDFMAAHPDVVADIELTDHVVDILQGGVDLAIRVGPVTNPDLVVRKLCVSQRWVVCSPELLEKYVPLSSPGALSSLPCLLYTHQSHGDQWHFHHEGEDVAVSVRGRMRSNNGDLLADAAAAGLGFAWLPDFIVRERVQQGELVQLFSRARRDATTVHAVLPCRSMVPKRVQALMEYLRVRLGETDPERASEASQT